MNRATAFFMQPITLRSIADDVVAITQAALALTALLLALAVIAHLPSIALVIAGLWAMMNGRVFSMIIAFMLAVAWFNWLWGISAV